MRKQPTHTVIDYNKKKDVFKAYGPIILNSHSNLANTNVVEFQQSYGVVLAVFLWISKGVLTLACPLTTITNDCSFNHRAPLA